MKLTYLVLILHLPLLISQSGFTFDPTDKAVMKVSKGILVHIIMISSFNAYRRVAEIQIFEKTYLIVIKDETGLKFKMNDSTLFLIGSYAQKSVASY